jgi:hypothetical protein
MVWVEGCRSRRRFPPPHAELVLEAFQEGCDVPIARRFGSGCREMCGESSEVVTAQLPVDTGRRYVHPCTHPTDHKP